mmetsp:Transcript_1486/g.4818  ORF Transcript_1486/g.4818 Transcript_1486/m.4818 type:complete len:276 (+) Transcript_1486:1839-2666(+)
MNPISRRLLHDSLPLAVNCQPPRLLHQHRHGIALVQHPQLALGVLLVRGVHKHPPIQQRPMHVRHHTPHIPQRALARRLLLLHIRLGRHIPVHGIPLVDGINRPVRRKLHVWMCQHKLTQKVVQRKPSHPISRRYHHIRHGTVHAVARSHHIHPRPRHILQRPLGPGPHPVHPEDRPDTHPTLYVAAPVQRIKHHAVVPLVRLLKENRLLLLLGNQDSALSALPQHILKHLVGHHIQLFLVLALHVLRPGLTQHVVAGHTRTADRRREKLAANTD